MEIADIESKISAARSRIRARKDETKSCMWFDEAGAMKISDPKRLEALNTEIKRLEGMIEHDTTNLAGHRSMVGDRPVSEVLDGKEAHAPASIFLAEGSIQEEGLGGQETEQEGHMLQE